MHYLIGFITAVMVLFPASDSGGKSLYQLWMESYEKYLYQQMAENFERARNEQAASEEVEESHELLRTDTQNACEIQPENTEAPEEQTEVETSDAVPLPTVVQTPLFSVNGAVLDIGVQEYLYQRLCEANIGWFYHYAILIAYQESRFDFYAVNQKNHLDMGLFQYRSTFWNYGDIFNPYDQINVFTVQMMQRANVGCSVAEMISRHKTSDWGSYDQEYVNQVMQWESVLVQMR